MFNLKKASLSLATVALATTAGTLLATTAQAAIIGGQVSGIWEYDYDGEGGFNVGDAFTADFTYDSDSISTTDFSDYYYGYDKYLVRAVSLLSLVVNSGTISQVFDFSSGTYQRLQWFDLQGNPDYTSLSQRTGYYLYAYDFSNPLNFFEAQNYSTQYSDGSSSSVIGARAYSYDYSTGTYPTSAQTYSNITFSDPFLAVPSEPTVSTPEPTSALLTGLVGLGSMALYRRKKVEVVAE